MAGNAVTTPRGVLVLSASFTRPNDTTAYAINDLVGIDTSVNAGNTIQIPQAVTNIGDAMRIERVRLRKSSISLTNAQFRVHLFEALPTWAVGDNGAGGTLAALAVSDMFAHCGYIDVTMDRASATAGAYGVGVPSTGGGITVQPISGTRLYFSVQALAAYAPAASEQFTVSLEGIRP